MSYDLVTHSRSMKQSLMIQLESVCRTFKHEFFKGEVTAVADVSLNVSEGEVYGLIGPNGSGKSTTMKMVLGLVTPSSGRIYVGGDNIEEHDPRSMFGYLPENPYFSGYLSGEETLRYYARLASCEMKNFRLRLKEIAELVGLKGALQRSVGTYSKGMLQRLGLAQALIHDPSILILDEPTAGVDPQGAYEIREIILDLKKRGKTVFMCSHFLSQVEDVCDRVGVMHEGRLIKEGDLGALLSHTTEHEVVINGASESELKGVGAFLKKQNPYAKVVSVQKKRRSLEGLFIQLTKAKKSK